MELRTALPVIFFGLIVILVMLGVPIWLCVKTRPLGPLRYRWGTFMGIQCIVIAVISLRYAAIVSDQGGTLEAGVLAMFTLLALVAGVGVLRRKRWGVVSFFLVNVSLILLPLLISTTEDEFNPSRTIAPLAGLGINIRYFARRWKFMGLDVVETESNADEVVAESEADLPG
jgi:hypothetical protein